MFENGHNMIPLAAILSIGEKVLDKVLPDPEAKAKAQASLMEMAQRGELAQLEAQVKEMQSARDREVQIATSASLHPMLKQDRYSPACAWYGRVNLYSVRGHHFCGCGYRFQGHLDLCARCADLCGHDGVGLLLWIVGWQQGKERPA
jgi:hypothetical protein